MPALLVLKYIQTNKLKNKTKTQNQNQKQKNYVKNYDMVVFINPLRKKSQKKCSSHSSNLIAIMINDSKTPFKHGFLGFSSL